MRATIRAVAIITALITASASNAGETLHSDEAFALAVTRVSAERVVLTWTIADGYYLYRNRMSATDAKNGAGLTLELPKGEIKEDPTFGSSEIYRNCTTGAVSVSGTSDIKVTYQGCQENGICYPPIAKIVSAETLKIRDDLVGLFSGTQSLAHAGEDQSGFRLAKDDSGSDLIPGLLRSGGSLWVLASFFVFGILLAFTPCVLPMYPILAGVLANSGEAMTAFRGFTLSSIYVLGSATAFGLLGIAAAWSGENLQVALQTPDVAAAITVVFVLLAISMFGAFELRLPASWLTRISKLNSGRQGSAGAAAFLGFTSALIIGPCVTAPLAAALIYIAQTGDARLGALALFTLGLGQGVPLIAIGTFGSRVLPRAGMWMNHIKIVFGFVFLGTATWMASRIASPALLMALWAIVLIATGVFLGAFDATDESADRRRRVAKAVGLIVSLYGIILGMGAASGSSDPLRPLQNLAQSTATSSPEPGVQFEQVSSAQDLRSHLLAATAESKSALVYFTADWCVACKVIEKDILSTPPASAALRNLRTLKVDLTRLTGEKSALMRELAVAGPPTMIFFNSANQEAAGSRLVGEMSMERFLSAIELGSVAQSAE